MLTVYISYYRDNSPETRHMTEHKLGLRLLAHGLSELFGLSFSPSDILLGPYGKPSLKSRPDIHFGISHCRGLAVCAFADTPVGVDAENIRPFREHLLKKTLTLEEQCFLDRKSTNMDKRREWFFRFWTLKESRIKESGTGMSVPLTGFSFTFSENENGILCSDPGLFFHQVLLKDSYLLSTCTSGKDDCLRIIECL